MLERIWKYKFHYVIVLPALLLVFVFKLLPLFTGLVLPFKDYKVFAGLWNSEWIGWGNFGRLFEEYAFRQVFLNTIIFKSSYIIACSAAAFLAALAVSGLKSRKLRAVFSTIFLMPYFIPAIVIAYLVMLIFSRGQSPFFPNLELFVLGDTDLFRPLLIVTEVLRTFGIPVVIALAAIAARQAAQQQAVEQEIPFKKTGYAQLHIIPALKAITAFMLLQFSVLLTTDFELLYSLLNPLVYETGDMLATYYFRMGFMNADFGMAGALWLFQFAVQLLFTVLAYLVIRGVFLHDLFRRPAAAAIDPVRQGGGSSAAGIIICSLFAIPILTLLYLIFIYPFAGPAGSGESVWNIMTPRTLTLYFILYLSAAIVHMLITITLAFPLTVKKLPGRTLYKVFLLLIMVFGTGSIHEYLFYRASGMINTFFPSLFSGFFAIISVFVLKSIFNARYSDLKEQFEAEGRGELHAFIFLFIPKIWKPLIALGMLQFIALWNSYTASLLYMSNPEGYSPAMKFLTLTRITGGEGLTFNDPVILLSAAVLCIPPLLLLIVFRSWITSEVLISQGRR